MGTTPKYGYRYPEPTDPVAAGADNIKNLALDVEAKNDFTLKSDAGKIGGPYVGGWGPGNTGGIKLIAGHVSVNTSPYGDGSVAFPGGGFANGLIALTVTPNEISKGVFWWPEISSTYLGGFSFFAISVSGYPYATGHPPSLPNVWTMGSGTVTIDYIAIGV